MEEKKLTDDKEVIRLLEIFASDNEPDGVDRLAGMALDLIRRLQYDNSSAHKASEEWRAKYEKERKENAEYEQKLYDGELLSKDYHDEQVLHYADENYKLRKENTKLKTELQKECQEHLAFAELAKKADKQQKEEIERLKDEKAFYKEKSSTLSEDYESLKKDTDRLELRLSDERVKNAEIQKQVDELKANQVIECHGMLKGCDMVKQAVKDTARELLQDLYQEFDRIGDEGSCGEIRLMAERYGVEVE